LVKYQPGTITWGRPTKTKGKDAVPKVASSTNPVEAMIGKVLTRKRSGLPGGQLEDAKKRKRRPERFGRTGTHLPMMSDGY